MNWQEVILSIKRATRLPLTKIAQHSGVSIYVISEMHCGRSKGRVLYDNGAAIIKYAKQVGADLSRAKL